MKSVSFSKSMIINHIIFWFIVIILNTYFRPVNLSGIKLCIIIVLKVIAPAFAYYTTIFFAAEFYPIKKTRFIVNMTIICFIHMILEYFIDIRLSYYLNNYDLAKWVKMRWAITNLVYFILVSMLAISFYRSQMAIALLKEQNENRQTKINKEIHFLKNQFNPHISFNFLNYCYSYVLKNDPSSAKAIADYSDMLRYTLSHPSNSPIALSAEIDYINKYIALQRLFHSDLALHFNVNGSIKNILILPRILINFIENAFKHGELNDVDYPIDIKISIIEHELFFSIANKIRAVRNEYASTQTGFLNSQKQLDLFYQNRYELKKTEDKDNYICELKIWIK
jgi:two-component system, LytTR family, sensor kinase